MVVPVALSRARLQLPILKIRPQALVQGVMAEVGPLWFSVHWVDGRQVLCSLSDVSPCALCASFPSRVIGMTLLLCRLQGVERMFLLELSPVAFSNFEARLRFCGVELGLGVVVEISRPRAKGCLRIEVGASQQLGAEWVDAEFRLLAGWCVLYGLPLPVGGETFQQFLTRVSDTVIDRAAMALSKVRS